jgi:hypothetical protein
MELEDVLDRGAAERVDRLVVVPDDRDVAVRGGQGRHELGLRRFVSWNSSTRMYR